MRAVPKQSLGGKMAFPSRSLGRRRKDEILCPGAAQNDRFLTENPEPETENRLFYV
jgi:hypothetical protein